MVRDTAVTSRAERRYIRSVAPAAPQGWMAIVNPSAGPARADSWRSSLRRRLQRELGVEVVITRSFGQISELLGEPNRPGGVAVFGGDGTIAEVVNHMNLATQRLLLLPGGTGNGLARDLGLTSVDRALAAHRANAQGAIDLLHVTFCAAQAQMSRLVVSTASLGYAAETVVLAKQLSRALGPFRYTAASILQASRTPARSLTVEIDGAAPRAMRLTNLMVNNTRHAGNFSIFRQSSLQDGQSDVLLADNSFSQQVLYNLGLLTHTYSFPRGLELSAKTMRVCADVPLRLMLDGEIWDGVHEVSFTVLPRRLRCYHLRADLSP